MNRSRIHTYLLGGFDDPQCGPDQWNGLLKRSESNVVFLTWEWQSIWWECFGRGRLVLVVAERDDELVAIAPLYYDGGMVFFVGSGRSDYLDFIGETRDPDVLHAVLTTARDAVPDLVGFRFYHVPERSSTGRLLQAAAPRLGFVAYDEGELVAPALDLTADPAAAEDAANRTSLVRHERWFQREGALRVEQARDAASIRPHLETFFAQHVARWAGTPQRSLFEEPTQRHFYARVTEAAGDAGWLRFTRVLWKEQPIAFHFGFCYSQTFLWYKPSFDIGLARRSPGEVLLRQLLLAATAEGAHTFDFGLGDEAFKRRFASQANLVRTWGLYPPAILARGAREEECQA